MAVNMSYCRWQNTLLALHECAESLEGTPPSSREELAARRQTFEVMADMFGQLGVEVDLTLALAELKESEL